MKASIPFLTSLFVVVVIGFSLAEETTLIPSQPHQRDFKGNCSYNLEILTSCFSPRRTKDHISIAFGDKDGNQVLVPRLDKLPSVVLDRCVTNTISFRGPCTNQICYMYIYRIGDDGWKPHHLKVIGNFSDSAYFFFGTFIPEQTRYSFNYCNISSSSPSYASA